MTKAQTKAKNYRQQKAIVFTSLSNASSTVLDCIWTRKQNTT